MKLTGRIFAIIFLLFAAVQLNDPDPEIWAPVYGYAAVISALIGFKKVVWPAIIIGVVGYFAGAVYMFTPDVFGNWISEEMANQTTDMKTVVMEEGREFWGLVICFIMMTIYMFYAVNKRKINIG